MGAPNETPPPPVNTEPGFVHEIERSIKLGLSSHPPIDERIAILDRMAHEKYTTTTTATGNFSRIAQLTLAQELEAERQR